MSGDPGAAARVVRALAASGSSVAAAESLTGGLLTAALTDVPGSSAVLRGGVVAYATDVKRDVLGVPEDLLRTHGAVSEACAVAMAQGVRRVLGATWGVSTTGVAGPGPSEGHPAGTVHVAVAGEHGTTRRALHLHGSRCEVRALTVTTLLELLGDCLAGVSGPDATVEVDGRGTDRDIDDDDG